MFCIKVPFDNDIFKVFTTSNREIPKMSKFTIVTCAILLALAGTESSDKLERSSHAERLQIESILNAAIEKIKKEDAANAPKVVEIEAKFAALAESATKKLDREMVKIVKEVEYEANHFIVGTFVDAKSEFHGVEIADCNDYVVNLDRTRISVIGQIRICALNMSDSLTINTKKMSQITDTALYDLNALQTEIFHCSNMVTPAVQVTAYNVIFESPGTLNSDKFDLDCKSKVELKAALIVKSYIDNLASLHKELKSFETYFDGCTNRTDYQKFLEESSNVLENTTKCINRKIH